VIHSLVMRPRDIAVGHHRVVGDVSKHSSLEKVRKFPRVITGAYIYVASKRMVTTWSTRSSCMLCRFNDPRVNGLRCTAIARPRTTELITIARMLGATAVTRILVVDRKLIQ
jgi:hypothetical protein